MNFRAEDKQLIDSHIAAMSKETKQDYIPEVTLKDYIKSIEEKYPEKRDNINPKHYDLFPEHGIQVREVCKVMAKKIEAAGHGAFFISDYVQMLQYLLRFQDKNGLDDLNKAEFYLRKLIEEYHEGEA